MFRLRTARAPVLILAAATAIIGIAAACGGDDDSSVADICDEASQVVTNQTGDYSPIVISSDLAVGQNRFVLGLLDADGAPVVGADLEAQFCRFTDSDGATLESEVALSAITVERSFTHIHDDGELHQHDVGEIGVYVSNVDFTSAGQRQVFVSGTADDDEVEPTPFLFEVHEASQSPAIGSPAPQSVQLLIDDVDDITEIDTSTPPNPEMHNITIADAVTSGRPTIIVFASPAFCTSQICGPTKEIVDALYSTYGDRVNFVHVEPYDVARVRDGDCQSLSACIVPFITDEWRLQSEPWVFVIDSNGDIAGKFEGVVGKAELEENLLSLLAS